MIEKVISGGQTGADQAGWRVAKRFGLATGGWMPRGFLTEAGPRPEFAAMYGAREHGSREYPPRTRANVEDSDLTLWFGDITSLGYACTERACEDLGLPIIIIFTDDKADRPLDRLKDISPRIINVSGNREMRRPGIGAWVEDYLTVLFRLLGLEERL